MFMIVFIMVSTLIEAAAAPVGDPLSEPSIGRVRLGGVWDVSQTSEFDTKCSGEACSTNHHRKVLGVQFDFSALRGVGFYAVAMRGNETVREAQYEGSLTIYGGGARLAIPIRRSLWLASTTDLRFGQSMSQQAERVQDPAHASERKFGSSLLAAIGNPKDGGHLWAGVHGAWLWDHTLHPVGDTGFTVDVPLRPKRPLSGVVGGTMISDVIGKPWRTSPRLQVCVEGRVGQETGVHVTTGIVL